MDTNKQPNTQPDSTPTDSLTNEDLAVFEELAFDLFDQWTSELTASGEEGKESAQRYAQRHGIKENSPLAMMYSAFEGGLVKGIDLAKEIYDLSEE